MNKKEVLLLLVHCFQLQSEKRGTLQATGVNKHDL